GWSPARSVDAWEWSPTVAIFLETRPRRQRGRTILPRWRRGRVEQGDHRLFQLDVDGVLASLDRIGQWRLVDVLVLRGNREPTWDCRSGFRWRHALADERLEVA